jgi:hypothetical protein
MGIAPLARPHRAIPTNRSRFPHRTGFGQRGFFYVPHCARSDFERWAMTVFYTALTPTGRIVSVVCASLDEALHLAEANCARGWAPTTIRVGQEYYAREAIIALLDDHGERDRRSFSP